MVDGMNVFTSTGTVALSGTVTLTPDLQDSADILIANDSSTSGADFTVNFNELTAASQTITVKAGEVFSTDFDVTKVKITNTTAYAIPYRVVIRGR
jgi:hypothetical protein